MRRPEFDLPALTRPVLGEAASDILDCRSVIVRAPNVEREMSRSTLAATPFAFLSHYLAC